VPKKETMDIEQFALWSLNEWICSKGEVPASD